MNSLRTRPSTPYLVAVVKILVPLMIVSAVAVAVVMIKGWHRSGPLARLLGTSPRESGLWCNEHGVEERLCTLCHAELKDALQWCGEHGLPEELCTLCHSELTARYKTCAAHGLPESFCPPCNRPADAGEPARLPEVRLGRPGADVDAGVEVQVAASADHVPVIECNAHVDFNLNRFAHVRPRVEGILREVLVDTGAEVRRGDVLAVIDSAALGEAKADYLASLALVELADEQLLRIRGLVSDEIAPRKRLLEAENRLKESQIRSSRARQTLLNLGLHVDQVQQVTVSQDTGSLLQLLAPLDGVIVSRHAVTGEPVEPNSDLFSVADLSTMWVHLDMYEQDLSRVRVGQKAGFRAPSLPDAFHGTVTWISSEVDPRTRTVPVRVEVDNAGRALRVNMFGTGYVQVGAPHSTLTVPKEAVQSYEGANVVFVKRSALVYESRRVEVGHRYGSLWEITSGVRAGEEVVTTGSFLFKTELMRSSIGSGCCE